METEGRHERYTVGRNGKWKAKLPGKLSPWIKTKPPQVLATDAREVYREGSNGRSLVLEDAVVWSTQPLW